MTLSAPREKLDRLASFLSAEQVPGTAMLAEAMEAFDDRDDLIREMHEFIVGQGLVREFEADLTPVLMELYTDLCDVEHPASAYDDIEDPDGME